MLYDVTLGVIIPVLPFFLFLLLRLFLLVDLVVCLTLLCVLLLLLRVKILFLVIDDSRLEFLGFLF